MSHLTSHFVVSDALCDRAGVITDVRKKEFFEKPTWVNKRKKAAAVKRTHKEMSKNRIHRKRMY